jgi:hypothetical protein
MARPTYRGLLSDWAGVIHTCDGIKCRKGASEASHRAGFVDTMGYIHWSRWDQIPRAPGTYRFLRLVGQALHPTWRKGRPGNEPEWLALYHIDVWATEALQSVFHRRAHVRWTVKDRARSWQLAHKTPLGPTLGLTKREWLAYRDWVANGRRQETTKSYLRRPVTKEEVDSWREDRDNGFTYEEVSRRYRRAPKVLWQHLKATEA